jgi:hypothetical protein
VNQRKLFIFSFFLLKKIMQLEGISKIVDHVKRQGVNQGKSAAYMGVCEHFDEVHNTAF